MTATQPLQLIHLVMMMTISCFQMAHQKARLATLS
jgi:hypothetical protein